MPGLADPGGSYTYGGSSSSAPSSVGELTKLADRSASEEVVHSLSGLEAFSKREFLFLVEQIAAARVTDGSVWHAYTSRLLAESNTLSLNEVCAIIHCMSLVNFPKHSLINRLVKLLQKDVRKLSPWQITQVLHSLQTLGRLDDRLFLAVVNSGMPALHEFPPDSLPVLLNTFAAALFRDEKHLAEAGRVLQRHAAQLNPSGLARSLYAMTALDFGSDEGVVYLTARVLPRRLVDMELGDLLRVALSLVQLDLPQGELLSFVLQRIARQAKPGDLAITRGRWLRFVSAAYCAQLPKALEPAMRESMEANPAAAQRCTDALQTLLTVHTPPDMAVTPSTSKLHKFVAKLLDKRLDVKSRELEPVGPYLVQHALPCQVALEVQNHTRFYLFSQRETTRTKLRRRVLEALGWRVISIPRYELPRREVDQIAMLEQRIEEAAGLPMESIRKLALIEAPATQKGPRVWQRRIYARAQDAPPPARGRFGTGKR